MEKTNVQPLLIKPTQAQIEDLRETLSGLLGEYIELEGEKTAADKDWNLKLANMWDEIVALRARIEEAEEAVG